MTKSKKLPLWFLNGEPQWMLPQALAKLSLAEKMMIQRLSPVVPMQHIKNGVFGLCGHVCAFEQDIESVACILPRLPDDSVLIKVVKEIQSEIGSSAGNSRMFTVNRLNVIAALEWLKKYNNEYADITIDKTRLDWINGDEADLVVTKCDAKMKTQEDDMLDLNIDCGPNRFELLQQIQQSEQMANHGVYSENGIGNISTHDTEIQNRLENAIDSSPGKKNAVIHWPAIESKPVSEYEGKRIFALSFPWLFPGGIGDIQDFGNGSMKEWGEMLLRYRDGRFQEDKMFCFYALNYIVRNRNASQANWFILNFNKGGPETIEDLQDAIADGDNSFLNRMSYMNEKIIGSTAYWHSKRRELNNWINHHVQQGNGAPMFFITLSCAEHYWPDIFRLIRQRLEIAGKDTSACYPGSNESSKLLNDYALVVQEYFQLRVKEWLDTVGKLVFGIKHYWVRYEFAPGRGQIHAHLLAISNDNSIYELCHNDLKKKNGNELRAKRLHEWSKEKFGLMATFPTISEALGPPTSTNHPSLLRFSDPESDKSGIDLIHRCQTHRCSGFCMRTSTDKSQ